MPLLLPVRDTDFDTHYGAQKTLDELRLWVREMGYPNINFKFVPGRHPTRLSLYFWETGQQKKLKIADNLKVGEMIKFLNAWWLGFRQCNYYTQAHGLPKEMPILLPIVHKKKKTQVLENV